MSTISSHNLSQTKDPAAPFNKLVKMAENPFSLKNMAIRVGKWAMGVGTTSGANKMETLLAFEAKFKNSLPGNNYYEVSQQLFDTLCNPTKPLKSSDVRRAVIEANTNAERITREARRVADVFIRIGDSEPTLVGSGQPAAPEAEQAGPFNPADHPVNLKTDRLSGPGWSQRSLDSASLDSLADSEREKGALLRMPLRKPSSDGD